MIHQAFPGQILFKTLFIAVPMVAALSTRAEPADELEERTNPLYYLGHMLRLAWGILWVIGLGGTIIEIRKSKERRYGLVLIAFTWIVVVLSLPPTRTNRYLVSLWPVISILAVAWIPRS